MKDGTFKIFEDKKQRKKPRSDPRLFALQEVPIVKMRKQEFRGARENEK